MFEKDDYVKVTMGSADLWGDSSQYILKIHGIVRSSPDDPEPRCGLVVSRYSALLRSPLYKKCQTTIEAEASEKELVLHFGIFKSMGQEQDAEYLSFDDIKEAQSLEVDSEGTENPVEHVAEAPEGRFARILSFLEGRLNVLCSLRGRVKLKCGRPLLRIFLPVCYTQLPRL